MTSKRHTPTRCRGIGLIALSWLAACGARSESIDWDGVDWQAGGSSGAAGTAGKGGSLGNAGSGGSIGTGGKGGAGKGGSPGKGTCQYAGAFYAPGTSFPAGDGCNTCYCEAGGNVLCSQIACDACLALEKEYYSTLDRAKGCDPAVSVEQCTVAVLGVLYCGCLTYVNAFGPPSDDLKRLERIFRESGCTIPVDCGPCRTPVRGYCSPDGRCEDVY
jgi:hypothetical protein